MMQLRFEWKSGMYVANLTPEEALKAAVALRGLGLGLTYKKGQAMVTSQTEQFCAAERILKRLRR
jgi:hypothetical protein